MNKCFEINAKVNTIGNLDSEIIWNEASYIQ